MKYAEFREKVKNYPLLKSNLLNHITDDVPLLRLQISQWVKKGLVIQLKRGVYTLRDEDRIAKFSSFFLANQLVSPSVTGIPCQVLSPENTSAYSLLNIDCETFTMASCTASGLGQISLRNTG